MDLIHESIRLPEGQEEIYDHYCMVYIIVLYTCYIYLAILHYNNLQFFWMMSKAPENVFRFMFLKVDFWN